MAGALPAGLSLPTTFTGSGTTIGGTPAAPGIEPTSSFTVQGTDTQGQPFPAGMRLQTFSDPRDANNEMAGTPTTAGTYSWTMRVTDVYGHQASQRF